MNPVTDFGFVTVGAVSMLLLEGIKWLIQILGKKPEFGFPVKFYLIALPVLNALVPFPLVWLGLHVTAPTLTMGWLDIVKYLVLTVLASVISLLGYNDSLKPLKEKAKLMAGLKQDDEMKG